MYPLNNYPIFNNCINHKEKILKSADKFKTLPSIQKIDGKIYCLIDGFNNHMWENDIDILLDMTILKHTQEHDIIHLIHSDVVSKCLQKELDQLIMILFLKM